MMFSNFLVKNRSRTVGDLFNGKIKIQNNPGVANSYRTTHIFSPNQHEGKETIKFVSKAVSGPPNYVPAIPRHFYNNCVQQSGSGYNIDDVLEHPLKISEKEFDELSNNFEERSESPQSSPPSLEQDTNIQESTDAPEDQQQQQASPELGPGPSESANHPQPPTDLSPQSDSSPNLPSDLKSPTLEEIKPSNQISIDTTAEKRKIDNSEDRKPKRKRIKQFDFNLV